MLSELQTYLKILQYHVLSIESKEYVKATLNFWKAILKPQEVATFNFSFRIKFNDNKLKDKQNLPTLL